MAIFGSHSKNKHNNNSNSHGSSSSPLFSSLTPTSSNKSLQNLSITNSIASAANLHHSSSSHSNSSNTNSSNANVKLSINIESPPIVLYGNPNESSGSILSGLLKLEILQHGPKAFHSSSSSMLLNPVRSAPATPSLTENGLKIQSVTLALKQSMSYSKPFLPPSSTLQGCNDCKNQETELARWDVLTEPTDFARGSEHGYPFSYLIPGALPQTTLLSNIGNLISYELVAKVILNKGKRNDDTVQLNLPVIVKRSILRGPDRNSLRVFPPTDVTLSLVLPNVLYPKSSFPVELKLENVTSAERRWRMRKLNWRLEENIKVKLHSCDLHKFKLKVVEEHTRKLNLVQAPLNKRKNPTVPHSSTSFEPVPSSDVPEIPPTDENALQPQSSNTGISPVQSQTPQQDQRSLRNELDDLLDNDAPRRPIMNDSTNIDNQEPEVETEEPKPPTPKPSLKHALYLEEIRTIAHGELKSGWKSDFTNKGRIELVADINLVNLATVGFSSLLNNLNSIDSNNANSPHYNIKNLHNNVSSNCSCDLHDDTLGVYVTHMLVVELVVAEEMLQGTNMGPNHPKAQKPTRLGEISPLFANASNPSTTPSHSSGSSQQLHKSGAGSSSPDNKVGIPTGAARVLRMQFKVVLTERSGLGIAWDDEVPPTYHDVKLLSPPTYDQTVNINQLHGLDETPSLDLLSFPAPAAHSNSHRTPNVFYGVGETPGVSYSNGNSLTNEEELDTFQELRI